MNKLKIITLVFLFSFFFLCSEYSFAQAILRLGATATYINISNGAYLVIDNPTAGAIVRNAGGIISEGQDNRIKWNIGTTAGTYVVPWAYSTAASDYIPLSFTTTGAGSGSGSFILSTYRTGTCMNSAYLPTTPAGQFPTNYNSPNMPGDASVKGVDRFWRIEANGYTTKPDLSYLQFSYINSGANTEIGANTCANSLVEANLQAQRWNSTIGDWQGGSWIKGTQSGNVVTLSGVGVAPAAADFFTWWTLVDKNFPLPVTWLDFSANCERGNITIKWSTATEQNSDYFLLERSTDGNNFSSIGTVPAAKNSSTVKNYSFTDTDPLSGTAFYRITEVDLNGNRQSTNSVAVSSCSSDNIFVYFAEGSIYVSISTAEEGEYHIDLHNVLGQKIASELRGVSKGQNLIKLLPQPASGVYFVTVKNKTNNIAKKIFVRSVE